MNEFELSRMDRKLTDAACSASDNGGVELLEAASYSTRRLARILNEHGEHKLRLEQRRKTGDFAEPRGSRCSCPACDADYRVMAALG